MSETSGWADFSAPGGVPKINSIFDFSAEALGELKVWLEQSGIMVTPAQVLGAASQNYTPTWTGSISDPAVGNATYNISRYSRNGRTINATVMLTMGSTTTFGSGFYKFSLPVAATSSYASAIIGSVELYDNSADSLWTGVVQVDATDTSKVMFAVTAVTSYFVTNTIPFTWAQSDQIKFTVTYEAGS